ncbi:hypothetical protein MK805_13625 [Shimazuella sp. AN120528]|uniref:hypothetical protein n=1 Tax=Shimazuella soli TaxID=1892854 RepID=UPI001F10CF74|nr:hypothetical protein [Shimazuella soli]MCH5585981.1 hypothetical protein [Shimazuella soli]
MIKMEALFHTPADKALFKKQIQEEFLPKLYQMPYIEKIELTPFSDTPDELQEQFLDHPIYYQVGIFVKEEDIKKSFETEAGIALAQYLRSMGAGVTTAYGDTKIFYRWDLEQLRG